MPNLENASSQEDAALSAATYSPPTPASSNFDQQALTAMIQQAVADAVARQQQASAEAAKPRELSPEERARAALDNAGAGLGQEERLTELYAVVKLLAEKVGL